MTIRDAHGSVIDGTIPLSAALDPTSGRVTEFYKMIGGHAWRFDADGNPGFRYSTRETIVFISSDCSGPAYTLNSVAAGTDLKTDYQPQGGTGSLLYTVSNSTTPFAFGTDPLSGYDASYPGEVVPCTSGAPFDRSWQFPSQNLRLLTPVVSTPPSPLDGPFTYDRG